MRISDWSSDVCSAYLRCGAFTHEPATCVNRPNGNAERLDRAARYTNCLPWAHMTRERNGSTEESHGPPIARPQQRRQGDLMARDPAVEHTDDELRNGLRLARDGDPLSERLPLREELVHLGLARIGDDDVLHLTPAGRRFIE